MAERGIGALAGAAAVVALAGWLAGCAVQQPAQDRSAAGRGPAVLPSAAVPPTAWGRALAADGCAPQDGSVGDRLELLQRELEPLGLQARLQGCERLPRPGAGVPALLLDARVTDGRKAMAVVRGPLADGELLDLGLPQAGAGPLPDDAVSPDVRFNRQWWRQRLRAYGLEAVPGQVRAFVPSP